MADWYKLSMFVWHKDTVRYSTEEDSRGWMLYYLILRSLEKTILFHEVPESIIVTLELFDTCIGVIAVFVNTFHDS